jgi:hypothetical protein
MLPNEIALGAAIEKLEAITVKPEVLVAVTPEAITETSRTPAATLEDNAILAVIWLSELTTKLFVVISAPKLTELAPVKSVPLIMMPA